MFRHTQFNLSQQRLKQCRQMVCLAKAALAPKRVAAAIPNHNRFSLVHLARQPAPLPLHSLRLQRHLLQLKQRNLVEEQRLRAQLPNLRQRVSRALQQRQRHLKLRIDALHLVLLRRHLQRQLLLTLRRRLQHLKQQYHQRNARHKHKHRQRIPLLQARQRRPNILNSSNSLMGTFLSNLTLVLYSMAV